MDRFSFSNPKKKYKKRMEMDPNTDFGYSNSTHPLTKD